MVEISKYVRSKSQKILSTLDAVLSLPVTLDRGESGDTRDWGSRSFLRSRTSLRPEEAAYEAEFTGETQSTEGRVDVEALASVLSCVGCDQGCSLPLTSCRKARTDMYLQEKMMCVCFGLLRHYIMGLL